MKNKNRFQTGNVTLVAVTHLLHDIYSSFLAPIRPLLLEKFGISLGQASLWDLIQRLPWFLNPLIGVIAEGRRARWFVIVTPAVTAVTMSLLGVAPNFTVVAILLFTMGLSGAFFHVPSPVMIRQFSGDYTGRGMSFYMFGGEIARTLGPLVITGAVTVWGLEGTWKLIPFGLVASGILWYRLSLIDLNIAPAQGKGKGFRGFGAAFRQMLPLFLLLTGITFFRAIMKSGLTAFLPTYYYTDKGETLWFANSALALFQLAGAAGTLMAGTLSDRIGRKTLLLIVAVTTPVVMYLFLISAGIWSMVFLSLLGILIFAPGPVLLALVQDRAADKPVFANSIYMTISFVTASLSVVIAGYLGDWVGLETTYRISALLAIGAVPCILLLKSGKKQRG
ncbi:MAG: MFS transporter [Bacteroidales bacterium]